jgi:D-methionine transport system substrate-binding protein
MKKKFTVFLCAVLVTTLCIALVGCSNSGDQQAGSKTKAAIRIGCVPASEPGLKLIQEGMADLGYDVEIVMFDGNNVPATALKDGDLDGVLANHLPWLKTFNKENNCNLEMLQPYFYYSPMSLYSVKHDSIEALPNNAEIVVPGDGTNMDRSLKMLRDAGIITLGEKKGIFYTILDVAENPKNIKIIEAEITTTARNAQDVDAVIAVAFIAKSAGIDPNDYLFRAQDFDEFPIGVFVNGDKPKEEWTNAISEVIKSDKLRTAFDQTFEGTYVLFD